MIGIRSNFWILSRADSRVYIGRSGNSNKLKERPPLSKRREHQRHTDLPL